MLVGIPFVFGYGKTHFATNNMIFGAIVVILGVGMIFYELYKKERLERKPWAEWNMSKNGPKPLLVRAGQN